jgi:hypothetical protein
MGLVMTLALLTGCRSHHAATDYVPSEDKARAALTMVLNAWQAGNQATSIPDAKPRIEIADPQLKPGQTLSHFEILGEVPAEAPRCFLVHLELDNPSESRKVRYVVLGLDPLWVFRYEDYLMMTHWDHSMDAEKK